MFLTNTLRCQSKTLLSLIKYCIFLHQKAIYRWLQLYNCFHSYRYLRKWSNLTTTFISVVQALNHEKAGAKIMVLVLWMPQDPHLTSEPNHLLGCEFIKNFVRMRCASKRRVCLVGWDSPKKCRKWWNWSAVGYTFGSSGFCWGSFCLLQYLHASSRQRYFVQTFSC